MPAFGILFIVVGAFVLRQVAVGRATSIPTDAKDATLALLSGHPETIADVMGRRGQNVSDAPLADSSGSSGASDTSTGGRSGFDVLGSVVGGTYAAEVRKLGDSAKGYTLGGTGPSFYDCSGLLWRAAYNLGLYKGARFTTSNFTTIAPSWCEQVTLPDTGDIILWANSHMGVCVGNDRMYSARSPAKGIGESSISGDSSFFGRQPTYWRIK